MQLGSVAGLGDRQSQSIQLQGRTDGSKVSNLGTVDLRGRRMCGMWEGGALPGGRLSSLPGLGHPSASSTLSVWPFRSPHTLLMSPAESPWVKPGMDGHPRHSWGTGIVPLVVCSRCKVVPCGPRSSEPCSTAKVPEEKFPGKVGRRTCHRVSGSLSRASSEGVSVG